MTGSSDSTALSGVAITLVKNNVLQHITQTSEKGHSELNTISNRDYLLVSALIGYQIDTLKLSIHKSNISGLHIKLNEATESFQ